MIKLNAKDNIVLSTITHQNPFIAKITTNFNLPKALRSQYIFCLREQGEIPDGFGLVFIALEQHTEYYPDNCILLSESLRYLNEHDVVKYYPEYSAINVLYRKEAYVNSLLLTERCNSFCIMCSQPPKDIDDQYLVEDLLKANTPR